MHEVDLLGIRSPNTNQPIDLLPAKIDPGFLSSSQFLKQAQTCFSKFKPRTPCDWEDTLFVPLEIAKKDFIDRHVASWESKTPLEDNPARAAASKKILDKALLMGVEQDFQLTYLGSISFCDQLVCGVFNTLAEALVSNQNLDFFQVHREAIGRTVQKHKALVGFLRGRPPIAAIFANADEDAKFDKEDMSAFELHMSGIAMEAVAVSESAKTLWLEIYASEEFHDWLDRDPSRKLGALQETIITKLRKNLTMFPCLKEMLACPKFDSVWLCLKRLVQELGQQINSIYLNTGKLTQNRLVALDNQLRQCKLLPPHFIVAGVARLRARLQKDHGRRLKDLGCLLHVDGRVLESFWREGVRGFGSSSKQDPVVGSFKDLGQIQSENWYRTVIWVQVLIRDDGTGIDSKRRGLLFHFDDGFDRVVLIRSPEDGNLITRSIQTVSHRWKVAGDDDLELASLAGLKNRTFKQVLEMVNTSPRLWDSCFKEIRGQWEGAHQDKIRLYSISPLGRLLEDLIFSKKSLEECMKSFNLNGGSGGMMSFVMLQIPIVGGTIYTVMEFYGLGKILKSHHVSKADKVHEVLKKLTKVGFTMGAVFSSSIVGQIVIPVPVVGALVGGLVGGIVGKLFGDVVDSTNPYPVMKFSRLCKYLIALRREAGNWDFEEIDSVKHIMARWCTLTRPKKIKSDNLWLTMMSFLCLTLYHSLVAERDADDMQTQQPFHDAVEELNKYLEPTILYLAKHVDILNFEKNLQNGIQTLTVLKKEGYIKMDMKPKKE